LHHAAPRDVVFVGKNAGSVEIAFAAPRRLGGGLDRSSGSVNLRPGVSRASS
jgi:hypothetical protein